MPSPPPRHGRPAVVTFGLPLLAALLIASSLLVVSLRGGGGAGADPVVATVGSDRLLQSQLDGRVQIALTAAEQGGAPTPGASTYQRFLDQLRARALQSLIQDTLIAQEARARGVAATDADVQREVTADTDAAGGGAALATQLAEAGSTLAQLRDETRARLNEAQLEDYFAKQRVADILTQLTPGGDFAALAQQYSDDETSAAKGGDLGALALDQLKGGDSAFYQAVTTIPVGTTASAPVRDAAGYEILRVDAATATTRSVHRILVASPTPYTEKERPAWFTQSVLQAVFDDCQAGNIHVLVANAGQPCATGTAPSPGSAGASPASAGTASPAAAGSGAASGTFVPRTPPPAAPATSPSP